MMRIRNTSTANRISWVLQISYLGTLCRYILHELWLRKLRSFLAIFCIAWGTFTVIMLLALGEGFHDVNRRNIMNFAEGAFAFFPSETSKAYQGIPRGQQLNIKAKDIISLHEYVPDVDAVTPLLTTATMVSFNNKQLSKNVYGVSADLLRIRRLQIEEGGRFISKVDEDAGGKVVVLGNKFKTSLLGADNAIGKKVLINEIPFLIVGVLKSPLHNGHAWYDNNALIPYSTYTSIFGDQNVLMFSASAKQGANSTQFRENIRSFLSYKYHFDRTDTQAVKVFSTTEMLKFLQWFFIGVKMFLGVCGTLTLGVGSLGVANIMFLIVTERTREIGLRKAIGARDRQILWHILLEALIITLLGGLFGFLLAFFTAVILQNAPLPEWLGVPRISTVVVIVVITVLSVLGVLAGYLPARRAALLDPVEALRSGGR